MRRGSHDMQVNVAGIRRNLKNFAHNYSDAQKKVREATSNDPWGPSSTIMAEIADLTYNVVAFSEIMQMIWKRLNDHGRNWRHVYKALVLLEYLIKTGSEKVGQQCKENIFAIQTLKDFQHLEEGKDQGQNVREKAKQLCNLLKDDERLKNERTRALKAKERFAQSASGFGSDGGLDTPCSPKYPAFRGDWSSRSSQDLPREIENARPQTAGEEELQLQLALAMSREEADQEEQKRKSDDVRLQLALSQSQQDFKTADGVKPPSHMVDLLDVNLGESPQGPGQDPWGIPQPPRPQASAWQPALSSPPSTNHVTPSGDPWQPSGAVPLPPKDPWGAAMATSPPPSSNHAIRQDPWSPTSQGSSSGGDLDDFDVITNRKRQTPPPITNGSHNNGGDPFELNLLGDALQPSTLNNQTTMNNNNGALAKKTPQSFLGENSALVNLDNLVTSKPANASASANPFSEATNQQQRPVFNPPPPKPTINEMKQASFAPFTAPSVGAFASSAPPAPSVDPWAPVQTNHSSPWMKTSAEQQANPFLS